MKVYEGIESVPDPAPRTVLVLGTFDGVHRGHRALFALGKERAVASGAEAWAVTFDPHPSTVLAPSLAPPLLSTLESRLGLIGGLGMDAAVVLEFDRAFAATSPEQFVESCLSRCGAVEVVAGYDFTFGAERAGNVDLLRELCSPAGVLVHVVPPVSVDGGVVPSSTKIRQLLLEGRVEAAGTLLGRPYTVEGPVRTGEGRGRRLGFPTANVEAEGGVLLPANGVYAVLVALAGEGRDLWGAANIGTNPTFTSDSTRRLEVHVLDGGSGIDEGLAVGSMDSLVGRRMRVGFIKRLRAERRFDSAEDLTCRIQADVEAARVALGSFSEGQESDG